MCGFEIRKGTRDRCHPYPGGRPAVVVLLLLSRTSQVFSWIHKQMMGGRIGGLKSTNDPIRIRMQRFINSINKCSVFIMKILIV